MVSVVSEQRKNIYPDEMIPTSLGLRGLTILTIIVVLAGVAVRLILLQRSSVWYDDAISIYYGKQSLSGLIALLQQDVGEPLYFVSLGLWMRLWGDSEIAVGSLATVFSLLELVAIYFLGKTIAGKKVGLIAVIFCSMNIISIHHSSNVRYYALLSLMATFSYYCYFEVLQQNRKHILYALSILMGVYLHTYFLFVIFAQLLVALIIFRKRLVTVILCLVVPGLLYMPWFFFVLFKQLANTSGAVQFPGPQTILGIPLWFGMSIYAKILAKLPSVQLLGYGLCLLFFMVAAFMFFAFLRQKEDNTVERNIIAVMMAFAFSIGTPLIISLWKQTFHVNRYDIIILGLLFVILAVTLSKISEYFCTRPWIVVALLIIPAMALPEIKWRMTSHMDGDRAAIQGLVDKVTEDDLILLTSYSNMASLYYIKHLDVEAKDIAYYPTVLSEASPVYWAHLYSDKDGHVLPEKEEELRGESGTLLKSIETVKYPKTYLFMKSTSNVDQVLKQSLDMRFRCVEVIKVNQHVWGPLYDSILVYDTSSDLDAVKS
jgi:uncharacterized membrane protein